MMRGVVVVTDFAFDHYRPRSAWFHNPGGIHGPAHAARVLVRADELAAVLTAQGMEVDREVVRWAAVVHDVGRQNDGHDPQHGWRSGVWFLATADSIAPHLTEAQRQKVAYCCTWHVPWDDQVRHLVPDLVCLKDADGLDRLRFGGLDPTLLRTEHARSIVEDAASLVTASRFHDVANPWEKVREVALGRGEWR